MGWTHVVMLFAVSRKAQMERAKVARMAALLEEKPVEVVRVDGLALLRMVSHCGESLPDMVEGSVVGLVVDGVLEVTNSFAHPGGRAFEGERGRRELGEYCSGMLDCLRTVNLDATRVGTYRSLFLGSDSSKDLVRQQWSLLRSQLVAQREEGPNFVALVLDPVASARGSISLRALRLSKAVIRAHEDVRTAYEEKSALGAVNPSTLFEEIPVEIHNSRLHSALLIDVDKALHLLPRLPSSTTSSSTSSTSSTSSPLASLVGVGKEEEEEEAGGEGEEEEDFSRLSLSSAPYLEKQLTYLVEQVPELAVMSQRAAAVERKSAARRVRRAVFAEERKALNARREREGLLPLPLDDPAVEPACTPLSAEDREERLSAILLASQVKQHCREIGAVTGEAFGKLFLASALHKE